MRTLPAYLLALLLLVLSAPARAQLPNPDAAAVKAVVQRFHSALASGDAGAAIELLASDAVVLEGGELESRQQYLDHHLAEDIKFARNVPSVRGPLDVTVIGEVAWVASTSTSKGTFQGKPINLVGAELMVVSKTSSGWLIRAIHWSSRRAK